MDPDIVTGVENQYRAGISLSDTQPFMFRDEQLRVIILTSHHSRGDTPLDHFKNKLTIPLDVVNSGVQVKMLHKCYTNVSMKRPGGYCHHLELTTITMKWSVLSMPAIINYKLR